MPPELLEPPEVVVVPAAAGLEVVLLLDPHAATTSAEASAVATIAKRRGFKITSPSLGVRQVSAQRSGGVLSGCEPIVGVLYSFGRQPIAKAEVRVDEPPPRQRFFEFHAELPHVHVY